MAFKKKFELAVFLLQILFIIGFAFFVDYGDDLDATHPKHNKVKSEGGQDPKDNSLNRNYPVFQDVNVMIFMGIGFLYTFLHKYSYTGLGMNLLLCAISVQIAIFSQNWWNLQNGKIKIDIHCLIRGEAAAASAVIALGGIFGKVCPLQMVVFTVLEVLLYTIVYHLTDYYMQVTDVGESVALHMFAAIFGCVSAYVIDRNVKVQKNPNESPNYNSNIFCIVGMLLLWAFWPSFNAASDTGHTQHRNIMNTYLALIGSAITALATSSLLNKEGKFIMCHIQNSSLAGAVAVGAVCNLMIQPFGALLIGSLAGVVSVAGFTYFSPFLARIKIHDPCGINSLHGIPGLMSGLLGVVVAFTANEERYGYSLYELYPAMAPEMNTTALEEIQLNAPYVNAGSNRTAQFQALCQLFYILVVIIASIVGALITGLILRLEIFDPLDSTEMYLDEVFWDVPPDGKQRRTNASSLNNSPLTEKQYPASGSS